MSNLWQLILAIPEILRLALSLMERIKEIQKEHEIKVKLKDEVKIINEAIKTGDTTKLDRLRY